MTRVVVALTGISGVGKSTLVEALASIIPLKHLQASTLIKEARSQSSVTNCEHDQLRHLDIDENQKFLVQGFEMAIEETTGLIVLDGHTVIEATEGLTTVAASVFGRVATERMIFVFDEPSIIDQRRRGDFSRKRPVRHITDIEVIQDRARNQAEIICKELKIPLYVFRSNEHKKIEGLLRLLLESGR